MKGPLVSVVMPNYNYARFLPESIHSVQAQTCSDWELFVVDDASTDDSREVVRSFADQDSRIHLLALKSNRGARQVRNAGTLAARGRYIAYLDSDDAWMPQKLERQIAFMQRHNAWVSTTAFEEFQDDVDGSRRISVPIHITRRKMLRCNLISSCGVMYDSSKIGKQLNLHPIEQDDYTLWLDMLRDGRDAYGLNESLFRRRMHRQSYSANKFHNIWLRFQVYRIVERMGFLRSAWCSVVYLMHAIWRRKIQPGIRASVHS